MSGTPTVLLDAKRSWFPLHSNKQGACPLPPSSCQNDGNGMKLGIEEGMVPMHDEEVKILRLRGRKVCDRVLRKGHVWKGQGMLIRWLPGAPLHPSVHQRENAVYVGTLASRKLSKSAVERNRMRRRCREALRIVLKEYIPRDSSVSIQLLLCPRSPSLRTPFPLLQEEIKQFLSAVLSHLWPKRKHLPGSSSSS